MAKRTHREESEPEPSRVPGDSGPLPRVRLEDFLEAQGDPRVKQALREAREEGARLKRDGLLRD